MVKKFEKVDFKDVIEGDKINIRCDLEIIKISDLDDYLKVNPDRKVHKVECKLKSGPFKDQIASFVILDDDKVSLHQRPSAWENIRKFLFGKVKRK